MTRTSHPVREKTTPFTIRLTSEERSSLESRAGSVALGTYIKGVLFQDGEERKRRALRSPLKDQTALAEVLAALGSSGIAEHLASLAHDLRHGVPPDQEAADKMDAACRDVLVMRLLLLQALGVQVEGIGEDDSLAARFNRSAGSES